MGKKSKASDEKPYYPAAHPTAPGGMSRMALHEELVSKHGYSVAAMMEVEEMRWPDVIDLVCEERRSREIEAKEAAEVAANSLLQPLNDGTVNYLFDGHFGAGPSAAERWMNCTGSLELSREFLETLTPNQLKEYARSGDAARQGTTAHAAAEAEALLLLGRMTEGERDDTLAALSIVDTGSEIEAYNEEMGEYITEYLSLVDQYATERGKDRVLIEHRVSAVVPLPDGSVYEVKGSLDCGVLPLEKPGRSKASKAAAKNLAVIDLKYGDGIDVSPEGNPQVRIYALGMLGLLTNDDGELTEDIETITYGIAQPRLGGLKEWSETLDELLDWRDDVLAPALAPALAGRDGGATLTPSDDACQWCPARGSCPALAEFRIANAADLFSAVIEAERVGDSFPDTSLLTDERLGSLLAQAQGVAKIAEDLKAEAQRRLYRGEEVPGYHLVNYSPPRQWDEKAVKKLSGIEALWTPPTLVSPAKAIAALKGNDKALDKVAKRIVTPDKRPVAAPVTDRRKKWEGLAPEVMFADDIEEG